MQELIVPYACGDSFRAGTASGLLRSVKGNRLKAGDLVTLKVHLPGRVAPEEWEYFQTMRIHSVELIKFHFNEIESPTIMNCICQLSGRFIYPQEILLISRQLGWSDSTYLFSHMMTFKNFHYRFIRLAATA